MILLRPDDPYPLVLGAEAFSACPGGLNRYVEDLLAALDVDGGPEPRAVVVGPADSLPSYIDVVSDVRAGWRERLVAFGLRAEGLAPPADVIDIHFALYGAAALALRRVRRRPTIVHFHGPWADESAAAGGGRIGSVYAKRVIERWVYRQADAVVTLSQGFRRLVVERYGVSPWVTRVIPPAVDLERFDIGDQREARVSLAIPETGVVVAAVRRLVPRMGLDVLIKAWAELSCEFPGVLVIAGEGPLAEELRAIALEWGIEDRVRFLGRLDDEQLVALYRAADVVAVPSTALEGFGLVVLESLACGTPVVATDVGGLSDALRGLPDVSLVEPGQPGKLRTALSAVISKQQPSATECRAHASQFTSDSFAEAHRSLYREVAEGLPRRRRVVYLTHSAQPSGAELSLVRLIRSLGESIDAHVVLGEDGPLCAELERFGISYEVLAGNRSARRLRRGDVGKVTVGQVAAVGGAAWDVARLAVRLRSLRPDVVHTTSLKAMLAGGVAAKAAGLPVIWHLHDRIADDYLPSRAVNLVHRMARVVPTAVVANSAATLSTVPFSRGPGAVVGNAVFAEDVVASSSAEPRPFTVGMMGRLASWKGQLVAVDAFASAFPLGDARLRIVGAALFDEGDYEQELLAAIDASGVGDRIDLVGHRSDMGAELSAVDVVVHASVLPEPFGQVVVEAQMAGRPVIAADAGGVSGLIIDGQSGLLYPPGDVVALSERLCRLAGDAALRTRLGAAGELAAQAFSPEIVRDEMLAFYDATLGI